jgi:hypothetical protein
MLISDEHRSAETKRHITDPEYGGESIAYANNISTIINNMGIEDVLDYGAGKGELPKNLVLEHRCAVHLYDPAIPAISEAPDPHEMTICANVLEYVEEDCVDAVLDDLKRCTKKIGFISVKGSLSDWLPRIMLRFNLESAIRCGDEFFTIVSAREWQ